MSRDEKRGTRRWLRPFAVIIGLLFIPLLYRSVAVYEWRPGRCAASRDAPVVIRGDASRLEASAPTIRVVTWNIGGHSTLLDPHYISRIAGVIRSLDPDVIALQEVHRGTWQARFGDQLQELAERTGMTAVYSPSFRTPEGDYGNAILTRGRVLQASRLDLAGIGEPRAVLSVQLRVGGETLKISSTHLSAWGPLNSRWRRAQAECIAGSLGEDPGLLAGDLNTAPDSDDLQPLFAAGWIESDVQSIPTHGIMEAKLDYILLPRGFTARSVRVSDELVSDHRPLIAEIARTEV